MNFGDKFNQAEIDDIFGEFEVDDDGFLESKAVIGLFVAGGGEEKKEEEKKEEAPAAEAAPEEEEEEGCQVNKILLLNFTYTDTKCFLLSVWFLRQWSFLDSHLSDLITESRTGFLT